MSNVTLCHLPWWIVNRWILRMSGVSPQPRVEWWLPLLYSIKMTSSNIRDTYLQWHLQLITILILGTHAITAWALALSAHVWVTKYTTASPNSEHLLHLLSPLPAWGLTAWYTWWWAHSLRYTAMHMHWGLWRGVLNLYTYTGS